MGKTAKESQRKASPSDKKEVDTKVVKLRSLVYNSGPQDQKSFFEYLTTHLRNLWKRKGGENWSEAKVDRTTVVYGTKY